MHTRCRRGARAATAAFGAITALTARAAGGGDAGDLRPRAPQTREEALRAWRAGTLTDRLERGDAADVPPSRRVIAVVGITGSGKSSVCNTLAGRTHRPFALSSSLVSVTTAVSHRDYSFFGDWRVVDTPGLLDTNKARAENEGEVLRLAALAPHGLAAVLVVVPRGRFTAEQEAALVRLDELFGPSLRRHAILVVTGALDGDAPSGAGAGGAVGVGSSGVPGGGVGLMSRDALLAEVTALPLGHFLRAFIESVGFRVVPVENRLDPFRQVGLPSVRTGKVALGSGREGCPFRQGRSRAGPPLPAPSESASPTVAPWPRARHRTACLPFGCPPPACHESMTTSRTHASARRCRAWRCTSESSTCSPPTAARRTTSASSWRARARTRLLGGRRGPSARWGEARSFPSRCRQARRRWARADTPCASDRWPTAPRRPPGAPAPPAREAARAGSSPSSATWCDCLARHP